MSESIQRTWLEPFKWKQGQSGNPNGSRAYAHRLKAVRTVSDECMNRIATALFDGSMEDLLALAESADVTPMEKLCIGVVIKAYDRGDSQALGMLLDRFIGKVVEKKEISVPQANGAFASLSDDELAKRAAQLDEAGV